MGQLMPLPNDAVYLKDGHPVTTSLKVSEVFGRRHDRVMRAIKDLDCSEEFGRTNFGESSYVNSQNKVQPMFELRRDGLVFLVMGFTGSEAAKCKEAYIKRFNEMEAALLSQEPRVVEVAPTVTINAVEDARKDAELWRLKYENEMLKRKMEEGRKQNRFTEVEDAELIGYKLKGYTNGKIAKLMNRYENSIESRVKTLKKKGKL